MKFSCKNSGKCCSHPNIVVTVTHEDVLRLMKTVKDFPSLISRIQFMIDPDSHQKNKLSNGKEKKTVFDNLITSSGEGFFILRRIGLNNCSFYDVGGRICTIHQYRPQACRNFPFSFSKLKDSNQIIATWVNTAKGFCPGIENGIDYDLEYLRLVGEKTTSVIESYNKIIEELNKETQNNKPITPQEALMTIFLYTEKNNSIKEEIFEIN